VNDDERFLRDLRIRPEPIRGINPREWMEVLTRSEPDGFRRKWVPLGEYQKLTKNRDHWCVLFWTTAVAWFLFVAIELFLRYWR